MLLNPLLTVDSLTEWALSLKRVSSKVLSFLMKFFFHTSLIKRNLEIKPYLRKCLAGRCLLKKAVGNFVKLVTWIPNSLVCKRDITLSTSSSFLAFAFICSFSSLLTLVVALSFPSLGRLFAIPGIVARQAPLFMGFRRQGYRSGLPFPSPVDDIVGKIFVSSPCPLQ